MADHFPDATEKIDCISREAEIQFFNDWVADLDKQINDSVNHPHLRSDYKVCKTQLLDCIHAIKEMPAADVRPVVRGKWEIDNSYAGPGLMNLRCSVCGEFGGTWRDCTLPSMLYKFCPNCGADMMPDKNGQIGEKNSG